MVQYSGLCTAQSPYHPPAWARQGEGAVTKIRRDLYGKHPFLERWRPRRAASWQQRPSWGPGHHRPRSHFQRPVSRIRPPLAQPQKESEGKVVCWCRCYGSAFLITEQNGEQGSLSGRFQKQILGTLTHSRDAVRGHWWLCDFVAQAQRDEARNQQLVFIDSLI